MAVCAPTTLVACGGSGGGGESTSGAAFTPAASLPADSEFSEGAATGANGALIDVSHAADGYVGASATASSRLKLLVSAGDTTQSYDMPTDGTPHNRTFNLGKHHLPRPSDAGHVRQQLR